jgi:hypothetical protein
MVLPLTGRKIAWVALLLAASLPARANIGDNLDQLRQHYGSAKDMGGQMLFEVRLKDGQIVPARGAADVETHFTITVYFDGDRSGMEVFTRNTTDPAKSAITPDDITSILGALGNGIPWQPIQVPSGKQTWVWGSKKGAPPQLLARFDPSKTSQAEDASVLVIMEYTEK